MILVKQLLLWRAVNWAIDRVSTFRDWYDNFLWTGDDGTDSLSGHSTLVQLHASA